MKLQTGVLAVVVASGFFFTSCKCNKDAEMTSAVTENDSTEIDTASVIVETAKLDAEGNYIYDVGDVTEISLPDGTKLSIGNNSTENKLFTQLNDANFKVSGDKTQGWITLDRVYFATGKADLTPVSEAQTKNVVAILKAFPSSMVKIGGYTDNTGDAAVNKQVSTGRARTVADQIIANGIDKSRIESEGYGADHFVCPANDTDECKAQNRRVDIRVTKK